MLNLLQTKTNCLLFLIFLIITLNINGQSPGRRNLKQSEGLLAGILNYLK
jgi:hypothetical protein